MDLHTCPFNLGIPSTAIGSLPIHSHSYRLHLFIRISVVCSLRRYAYEINDVGDFAKYKCKESTKAYEEWRHDAASAFAWIWQSGGQQRSRIKLDQEGEREAQVGGKEYQH